MAGVVDDGYTSAEVSYGDELVAVVYERADGWKADLLPVAPQRPAAEPAGCASSPHRTGCCSTSTGEVRTCPRG